MELQANLQLQSRPRSQAPSKPNLLLPSAVALHAQLNPPPPNPAPEFAIKTSKKRRTLQDWLPSTPDAASPPSSRHGSSSQALLRHTAILSNLLDPNLLPPPPSPSNASSKASARTPSPQSVTTNPLHPRVAVILGVDRCWYLPLLICRALSIVPAAWWGLRCAFTFLAELLRIEPNLWRQPEGDGAGGAGGWTAAIVKGTAATVAAVDWDADRRFRVTEVALAIIWLHLSRENELELPLLVMSKKLWKVVAEKMVVVEHLRGTAPHG
ncbi:conserved hypothetical protein [Uncinocarpus reesii 1704]|uniref:Uncharacterized protein n=1 Tax=Uncinocarpus reesii (strain UAMH 1704) TaxID=336963 RepID=C4JE38_UNCRE|nr:uncharacterized protein UREG_00462 [Uncinocarpus reesii 1704]EEP75616.1 conserved hypothetical protein [Uncinocarpus reesii 1704]